MYSYGSIETRRPGVFSESFFCAVPWYETKDIMGVRLNNERRRVIVGRTDAVFVSMELVDSKKDKSSPSNISKVEHQFVLPLSSRFFSTTGGMTNGILTEAIRNELAVLSANCFLIHLENLIFSMYKYDFDGWVSLIRKVLGNSVTHCYHSTPHYRDWETDRKSVV